MLREPSIPSGPRPAAHPPRQSSKENHDPAVPPPRSRGLMGRVPPPVQQQQSPELTNKLPLYSFGGYDPSGELQNAAASHVSQDFLPSVNFDDLHQSIANAGTERAPEPYTEASREPLVTGSMIVDSPIGDPRKMDTTETRPATQGRSIPTATTRPGRSGSLLTRKTSVTNRQTSTAQSATPNSTPHGAMRPPESGMAIRTKRASQYPPISTSNVPSKGPRRSIGMNGPEADGIRTQRRAPNSISSTGMTHSSSIQSLSDVVAAGRALGAVNGPPVPGDASAQALTNSRAMKAKSLQPPSRNYPPTAGAPRATPDRNRVSSYVASSKSPARPNGRNTQTPTSAARRMSTMTGLPAASHASGLGARTVSPTDARRMKRLSTLQGVPPLPHTPPAGSLEAAMANRPPSHSPASIQKSITPSSLRTTPDLNRRSYMQLPNSQSGGFTPRSSTSSLQPPRIPQGASATSRLPTPKARSGNSEENTEEVPPVPAIPKAYESPKETAPEVPMYANRKSKLNFDQSSINSINSRNSSSTNEWSSSGKDRHKPKESISRPRIKTTIAAVSSDNEEPSSKRTPVQKKKQLQPLRLPPMNLLPLSTPTAEKVAKLSAKAASQPYGATTPPAQRNAKTPTTPMTASKTSFFSSRHRNTQRSTDAGNSRSNTSIQTRDKTGFDSPTKPMPTPVRAPQRQTAVSPFVSSSLPKSSSEYSFMSNIGRSKPSQDHGDPANDQRQTKVNGPRAQTNKLTKSPSVKEARSPGKEEPASATSLRRKLSLSWKRNTSKSSITLNPSQAATERDQEYPPQPPKHDQRYNDMPPPRLPISATMGNLSTHTGKTSPTPSLKTQYLDSKRRKSSISSLKLQSAPPIERANKDELWGADVTKPKQLTKTPTSHLETPKLATPRSASTITANSQERQRILGPKSSSMSLRSNTLDRWTMDLDKDDLIAEEEIRRLAMRRKETEQAAKLLDSLQRRATPKERVSPQTAIQTANLNIYERGEIMDFKNVYFCGTQTAQKHVGTLSSDAANHGYDDERGDYTIVVGDHLSFRYEIIDILGKGSFGQVVRCIDHMTGGLVAIKIIRNKKRFHQQALVEVDILQKLKEWDPKGKHSLVSFTSSFYFRGHLCISTELLDMNLYEFIKYNSFKGFSLKLIRRFTKQLLNSLLLLKKHKVIHCDLKPENILLTHPAHSELRVIDFGSSCFENMQVYTYIQSRFYRSPEVILGLEYGLPIDMWSVGCILAELWSGYPIFPGENETEQLACIMEVFGPPERQLIEKSGRKKLFFDSLGKPRLSVSSKGRRRKPSSKTLSQALKCDDEPFLDFLTKCLRWDQDRRLKPEEAMCHEFITGKKLQPQRRDYSSRGMDRERDSPIKRYNQIVPPTGGSGGTRPLPMPPMAHSGSGYMNGTGASKARAQESPSKRNLDSATRRVSAAVGGPQGGYTGSTVSHAQKRTSAAISNSASMQHMSNYSGNGGQGHGASGLRMPQARSMSGRLDLAQGAASAAMYKQ